jgi:hypothetical protein
MFLGYNTKFLCYINGSSMKKAAHWTAEDFVQFAVEANPIAS